MNDSKRRIIGTDIDWTGTWETNYGKGKKAAGNSLASDYSAG